MSSGKGLVLDANILLRAVFGTRVVRLLEEYEDVADFDRPDMCFAEAKAYIPYLAKRRRLNGELGLGILGKVGRIVHAVDKSLYESHEEVRANESSGATRGTGLWWQLPCY